MIMLNGPDFVGRVEVGLDLDDQIALVEHQLGYDFEIDRVIVRLVVEHAEQIQAHASVHALQKDEQEGLT